MGLIKIPFVEDDNVDHPISFMQQQKSMNLWLIVIVSL